MMKNIERSKTAGGLPRLLAAALLAVTAQVQAAAYSGLVVFGDSLSDSGNNAQLVGLTPPGHALAGNGDYSQIPYAVSGTYSNGPVWAQYLANSLGFTATPSLLGGGNYAFGGAQTSMPGPITLPAPLPPGFPYSLSTQLGMFMADTGGAADPNALYVVAGGGNNVRAALEAVVAGADTATIAPALATGYAADIGQMVDELQSAGARHILVWNAPDFGITPLARSNGPAAQALSSQFSQAMNEALGLRLAGEDIKLFDFFNVVHELVGNAASYGFANVTDACGAPSLGCDQNSALFYDGIHPTTLAHQALAVAVQVALVPLPGSLALLLLALALMALVLRRQPQQHSATTSPQLA